MPPTPDAPLHAALSARLHALIDLGRALRDVGYRFVTVTPETHRRVLSRRPARARNLRDVFGWSQPFDGDVVPVAMLDAMRAADVLRETKDGLASSVRFSTLGDDLFVHSSYPTDDADAVFFGPDTYRFCAAISASNARGRRAIDIGCGSGAGGLSMRERVAELVLADVSARALDHARVNAALAGGAPSRGPSRGVEVVESDVLRGVEGSFDLIVANPPYMRDDLRDDLPDVRSENDRARVYRHGGGDFGEALSVRIAAEGVERLARGGTMLLYTGAAIVDGDDTFLRAVSPIVARADVTMRYRELDPDVFGEELERPAYAAVERIAAVLLTLTRAP